MTKFDSKTKILQEITNELLENEFYKKLNIEGIVLTGSYVHGNTHEKSDIDMFVVVFEELPYIRHIVFWKNGKLVQLRLCSYSKFLKECLVYDRKRPAFDACKILFDKNGRCESAIKQSEKYSYLGPKKIDMKEQQKLICTIKNEIRTLEGLIQSENILAAFLLINELVYMNIEYYNNQHGYWMSNNNYLFTELKLHNKEIYLLAEDIITNDNVSIKFKKLKKMCSMIINDFEMITGEYVYDECF